MTALKQRSGSATQNVITVIEIGCANTASVLFALERLGAEAKLSSDPAEIAAASKVVLPGVGAAGFAMSRIHELSLYDVIRGLKVPLLGVCLGQQLLFDSSSESDVDCLGLIPGQVTRMQVSDNLVVPHIGLNQLKVLKDDPLTQGVKDGDFAYFVHSFVCPVNDYTLATSTYGEPFAAMVRKDNVFGCQFHPERSSAAGALILENFLRRFKMILYPAIDLINGECVRLAQGRFDAVTRYDSDPFKRLQLFNDERAEWVHIVDLDGAKAGSPQQHELIGRLAKASKAKIQTGGGVRTRADVQALLDQDVSAVVVGSAAAKNPSEVRDWLAHFGKDRITLALDVLPSGDDWDVALHGWVEGSGISLWEVLDYYPVNTAQRILVTDVSRDGMLMGPNMALMQALRRKRPDLEIQASGGVRSVEDLYDLKALGVHGAIVGKAIYEGLIDLKAALNVG